MKFLRISLLAVAIIAFTFSISFAASKKLPRPKPTTTHLKLPTFSALHVTGLVNVIITGTNSKARNNTVIESRNGLMQFLEIEADPDGNLWSQFWTARVSNPGIYDDTAGAIGPLALLSGSGEI